jgi:hypothetical protein
VETSLKIVNSLGPLLTIISFGMVIISITMNDDEEIDVTPMLAFSRWCFEFVQVGRQKNSKLFSPIYFLTLYLDLCKYFSS